MACDGSRRYGRNWTISIGRNDGGFFDEATGGVTESRRLSGDTAQLFSDWITPKARKVHVLESKKPNGRSKSHHLAIHDSLGITVKMRGGRKRLTGVKTLWLNLFENLVENQGGKK